MSTPPSPAGNTNTSPHATKKPQPIPWTHQETVHLIRAYQEKWYSLKRGQLKSSQWEEVAVTVAARCGYDHDHPSKSAIQCRHKMEKLRKRYREERLSLSPHRGSSWQYFDLMDAMERGPFPISAHPLTLMPRDENDDDDDDDDEVEEEDDDDGYRSRSRSINYILRKPAVVNRFAVDDAGKRKIIQRSLGSELREAEAVLNERKRRRVGIMEEEEERMMRSGGRGLGSVVSEVRAFAERMVVMESRKMEMMKETERWRMEMENKQLKMILDSQKKVVDMIAASFACSDEEDEF